MHAPPAVWCVMRETISNKNGLSPPCCSADLTQSHSYVSIYTFTLLEIFFLSNREQFVQLTPNKAAYLLPFLSPCLLLLLLLLLYLCLLFPSPLSLWLSPPSSIPFPQLFSALCLPASLPPHLSSGYMQQGTNSLVGGGADSEGEPEIKGKMGGFRKGEMVWTERRER